MAAEQPTPLRPKRHRIPKHPPHVSASSTTVTWGGGEILCNRTVTWKKKRKKIATEKRTASYETDGEYNSHLMPRRQPILIEQPPCLRLEDNGCQHSHLNIHASSATVTRKTTPFGTVSELPDTFRFQSCYKIVTIHYI